LSRPRGRLAALASVTALGLAACSSAGGSNRTVALLPDTAASAGSWVWTARCPFSPELSTGCQRAGPVLGSAQLSGDEWNLGSAAASAGSVGMAVNGNGAVTMTGDLRSAPPCTGSSCLAPAANTWVRGYPSVLYGLDQCHARTSPPPSGALPLPVRLSALRSDLVGTTTYHSQASQVTYDVAYDMWLNHSDTKTPCQTDGTVEVMVWTDYDEQALLPDSLKVATASIPFAVNGSPRRGQNDWSVYVSDIGRSGETVPWGGTLFFVVDKADRVSHGTVSVDLSAALSAAGQLLQSTYGWTDFRENYWLDTVPFGLEFGPRNAAPGDDGPTRFTFTLSSYCLDLAETPAGEAC
jgi:hypothetical protein